MPFDQASSNYLSQDPTTALFLALRNAGYRGALNSPFMQMMMGAAPGLMTAFQADRGLNSQTPIDDASNFGDLYQSFLSNILGGGSTGVVNQLNSTRGNLENIIGGVRNFDNSVSADPASAANVRSANPFLGALSQAFSGGQGGSPGLGMSKVLGSLVSPFMPDSLGRGYREALNNSVFGANLAYGSNIEGNEKSGNDIYRFLFPNLPQLPASHIADMLNRPTPTGTPAPAVAQTPVPTQNPAPGATSNVGDTGPYYNYEPHSRNGAGGSGAGTQALENAYQGQANGSAQASSGQKKTPEQVRKDLEAKYPNLYRGSKYQASAVGR